MTDDQLQSIARNVVIEIVAAFSTEADGGDTTNRLCAIAKGLRTAAGEYSAGGGQEFMMALADGIEPV